MEKSRKNNAINSLRNIKNLKRASKNSSGITLIALVITIVVLIILAGISIMGVTQTGIFDKAKLAKNKYEKSQEDEDKILNEYDNEIGKYSDVSGSRDSVTISKEEYGLLKNISNFSTDGLAIGKWNNGKFLYRKIIKVDFKATTTSRTYYDIADLSSENIDEFINAEGYWNHGNACQKPYNVSDQNVYQYVAYDKTDKKLKILSYNLKDIQQNGYIIIYYTKNN